MPRTGALLFSVVTALLACDDSSVFIQKPWPDDHVAAVIITGADGQPLAPVRIVPPRQAVVRWDRIPSDADVRVFARSWDLGTHRFRDGLDLLECGLTVGGTGGSVPPPDTSWSTPVVSFDEVDNLSFTPEPAPILTFDFRLPHCDETEPTPCPGFSARSVPVPGDFRPRRLVHLGDHALIVSVSEPGEPNRLARLTPDVLTVLDADENIPWGPVHAMTWDPRPSPGRVLLIYNDGRVVAVDREGRFLSRFNTPIVSEFDTGIDGLSLGTGPEAAFRLPSGSTEVIDIVDGLPLPGQPNRVDEVLVYSQDLQFVRLAGGIYRWMDGGWQLEVAVEPLETINKIGADRDYQGLVGALELVRVRDPTDGRWLLLDRPFDLGRRLRSLDGLLDARFVVVGERGSVAVWAGTSWCPIQHDGPSSTLNHVVSSTYGADAYAIGTEDGEVPIVLHIDVPDT